MTWARIDDTFLEHPKVLALGKDHLIATHLYLAGLLYANRQLTDGEIPELMVTRLTALPPATARRAADALVRVGLWEKRPDGYAIHDFSDYNRSKAKVLGEREQRQQDRVAGGKTRAGSAERDEAGHFKPTQQPDQQDTSLPPGSLAGTSRPASTPASNQPQPIKNPVTTLVEDSVQRGLFSPRIGRNGSSPAPSEAAVHAGLRQLWGKDPTAKQIELLREVANRRSTSEYEPASGWAWVLDTMARRPMASDPVDWVKAEDNRLKAEGMARALAQEAEATARKHGGRAST